MNIYFENVNLNSNSGPNSFAKKLFKHVSKKHNVVSSHEEADVDLCFIESGRNVFKNPMFQRIDGIYFNSKQNFARQNQNIKRTYDLSSGVIFQSNFNKTLTTKYFGDHDNTVVIHNGADVESIEKASVFPLDRYEKLFVCASSWRPHKRLSDNIRYFLEHSNENDGMIVAGKVDVAEKIKNNRIHYVGNRTQNELYSLYKKADYFIHLAWLDHCPNVVVDAKACGCKIICSSTGGTKEIAGPDAILIQEEEWDMQPVDLYNPPPLNFSLKIKNNYSNPYDMSYVAEKYLNFIKREEK